MEELLNKLIEKGWKPFGREKTLHITIYDCDLNVYFDWWFMNEDKKSFRELVSKESWLWQFVCENGMIKHEVYEDIQSWEHTTAEHSDFWYTSWDNYEYRLIESSLKDESELESFILENITIKWTK